MADFRLNCVKILAKPTRISSVFALFRQKSAHLKFFDLKRMKFWEDFGAEDAGRLTPVKDDKLKYAEITPFQADLDSYCQAWFVRSKKTIKAEKSHIICDFSTFIIFFSLICRLCILISLAFCGPVYFNIPFNHISRVKCLVTWQLILTATGSPAMCVGNVSTFTPIAVVIPPNPCGPMLSVLIRLSSSASISA